MAEEVTRALGPQADAFTRSFVAGGATASFDHDSTLSDPAIRPEIPGYELVRILGRGGMGLVYEARQLATNRTVAVKLMLAGELAGEAARQRFRLEAEATAKLSHSHIVQLFEAGEAGGRAFFSCEYMAGGSLASKLDGTPWDGVRAAKLLLPLARAVADAHAAGIVHRDLKPANVLLGSDGTPKVADFGLAKTLDSDSNTRTGAILGTPSYMPPEQAGGSKAVGPAADVYSLGAILYELVTGRPPFKGADFVETIDQVRRQEPVAPRVLQPKLPRDIETIALKCLQKEPAKRYASGTALAEDLERFLDGRPIAARPVGGAERAWRWAKRSPAIASLLALAFLLLAAGTAVSAFFAVRAETARGQAEIREKDATDAKRDADTRADELKNEKERADHLLYISQMNHAQSAYQDLRTARLTELLDLTRPDPGKADHRKWEWHFLHRQAYSWSGETTPDLAALPVLAAPLPRPFGLSLPEASPMVSSDGKRIIVAAGPFNVVAPDGKTHAGGTFDAETGALIAAHSGADMKTLGLRFFNSEGTHFAHASHAKNDRLQACVRDIRTGENVLPELTFPFHPLMFVNRDGSRVWFFTGASPGGGPPNAPLPPPVSLWERGKGYRAVELPSKLPTSVHSPHAVSPDGTIIALFRSNAPPAAPGLFPPATHAEIWNVAAEPKLVKTLETPDGWHRARFSASGSILAIQGPREVALFNPSTGDRIATWANQVSFDGISSPIPLPSDDGRTIAYLGRNSIITVAQREENDAWRVTELRGPSTRSALTPVDGLWLSKDGGKLLAIRHDGKILRWNLDRPPGYAVAWPTSRDREGIRCWAIPSRRGERVLYQAEQNNASGDRLLGVFKPGDKVLNWGTLRTDMGLDQALISADGRRVGITEQLPPDRPVPRRWSFRSVTANGGSLEFSELSKGELPFGGDVRPVGSGRYWLEPLKNTVVGYSHGLAAAFHLRDAETGQVRLPYFPARVFEKDVFLTHPIVDASDRYAATLTFFKPAPGAQRVDATLRAFDLAAGGGPKWEWTAPSKINTSYRENPGDTSAALPSIAYSSDGSKLALAMRQTDDNLLHVRVFDSATGAILRDLREPNEGPFFSYSADILDFDAAGRIVVADGRKVVVWADKDLPRSQLFGHEGIPFAAAMSADGSRLFTLDVEQAVGPQRRVVRVWDLDTAKEVIAIREPPPPQSMTSIWGNEMWLDGHKLKLMTGDGVLEFDGPPRK